MMRPVLHNKDSFKALRTISVRNSETTTSDSMIPYLTKPNYRDNPSTISLERKMLSSLEIESRSPSRKTSDIYSEKKNMSSKRVSLLDTKAGTIPEEIEASDAPFITTSNQPLRSEPPPVQPSLSRLHFQAKSQDCLIQGNNVSIFQPKLKIKNALFIYPHRTSASNHDLFSTLQGVKLD